MYMKHGLRGKEAWTTEGLRMGGGSGEGGKKREDEGFKNREDYGSDTSGLKITRSIAEIIASTGR